MSYERGPWYRKYQRELTAGVVAAVATTAFLGISELFHLSTEHANQQIAIAQGIDTSRFKIILGQLVSVARSKGFDVARDSVSIAETLFNMQIGTTLIQQANGAPSFPIFRINFGVIVSASGQSCEVDLVANAKVGPKDKLEGLEEIQPEVVDKKHGDSTYLFHSIAPGVVDDQASLLEALGHEPCDENKALAMKYSNDRVG